MSQLHLFRSVGLTNKRRKKSQQLHLSCCLLLHLIILILNVDVNIKELIGEIGVAPIVTQVDLLDLIVLFGLV
jgi:hypothetical protein